MAVFLFLALALVVCFFVVKRTENLTVVQAAKVTLVPVVLVGLLIVAPMVLAFLIVAGLFLAFFAG